MNTRRAPASCQFLASRGLSATLATQTAAASATTLDAGLGECSRIVATTAAKPSWSSLSSCIPAG